MKTETYVTKEELTAALRQMTDEIVGELHAFMHLTDDSFREVRRDIAATRQDISRVFTYLDSMAKQLEVHEDERLVMGQQIERAYAWLHQLADKLGIELKG